VLRFFEKWKNQLYRVLDLLLLALTYSPAARTYYTVLSNFLFCLSPVLLVGKSRIGRRLGVCVSHVWSVEDFVEFSLRRSLCFECVLVFFGPETERLDISLFGYYLRLHMYCCGILFISESTFTSLYFFHPLLSFQLPIIVFCCLDFQKNRNFVGKFKMREKRTSMNWRPQNPRKISPQNHITKRT
jgi:hypothetical protein